MRIAVLPPRRPLPEAEEWARVFVEELGATIVPRGRNSVRDLLTGGWEGAISLTPDGPRYHALDLERPCFHHAGLARTRVACLARGGADTLVRAGGLERGMSVLDCTLGKGVDATVASWVVGPEGRVVGVEASPILAAIARVGLARKGTEWPELEEAMARIEVVHADHRDHLASCSEESFDVVLFDPLFAEGVAGSTDMDALRALGVPGGIAEESLAEARRVARRRVLHKVRADRRCPEVLREWADVHGNAVVGYRVWSRA